MIAEKRLKQQAEFFFYFRKIMAKIAFLLCFFFFFLLSIHSASISLLRSPSNSSITYGGILHDILSISTNDTQGNFILKAFFYFIFFFLYSLWYLDLIDWLIIYLSRIYYHWYQIMIQSALFGIQQIQRSMC